MNLKEMRQKRHELKSEANGILDAAEKDGREALSEDEEKRFSAIEAEISDLDSKITSAERFAERRRSMTTHAPAGNASDNPAGDRTHVRIQVGEDRANVDRSGGFSGLAEFAQCVLRAIPGDGNPNPQVDERLSAMMAAPSSPHRETASAEGYMVPPEFRDQIWDMVFEDGSLLDMIDDDETMRNSVMKNRDESTPWGATGVQAYWGNEVSELTESKLETEGDVLSLHKLHAFVTASDELLEDAPRLNTRLGRKSGDAIRWKMVDSVVNGTGVGQPLGWMNSGALISTPEQSPGGSLQGADTIVAENTAAMYARMFPSSLGRAFWLANPDIMPQLLTMTLGDQPIYQLPREGFRDAPGGFLLGRPIRFHETAQTLGDKGDLQFVDPKGWYGIRKAGANRGMRFASSIHLFFNYDVQAFRWTIRFGGQPHLSAPIAPPNSSSTKSHFIVIDERDG